LTTKIIQFDFKVSTRPDNGSDSKWVKLHSHPSPASVPSTRSTRHSLIRSPTSNPSTTRRWSGW